MYLESVLISLIYCFMLIGLVLFYRVLVRQLVKKEARKLWFGTGVFILISFTIIGALQHNLIMDPVIRHYDSIVLAILWWFSLYYLTNQLIQYWIWNKLYLNRGLVFSRVFHDVVSFVVFLIMVTAIVYFVFDKSVFGIFTASGVFVIVLAYSAQSYLSDVFAGLEINTAKEFVVGDWIKVNDQIGKVVQINWHFVRLITKENNHLCFANSIISKLPTTNLSHPTIARGITLNFTLCDETSPTQFKKVLHDAAAQCKKVLKVPEPMASIVKLQESNSLYQLTYFTEEIDETTLNDEILSIVWFTCRRNAIKISSKELIPFEQPSQAQLKSFIKKTELFHTLNAEEIKELTANVICKQYGPPERLLEQGQANSSLYLLYSGSIQVVISEDGLDDQYVAILGPGDFLGEMSLMTGAACNASAYVLEETVVIEITHMTMSQLVHKHPALVKKISAEIVRRKLKNQELHDELTKTEEVPEETLIDRIVHTAKLFFHPTDD